MEIKHNTKNLLDHPLPDLLEKFYTAAVLKQFAEMYLYPLFPDLRAMEKPRKVDLICAVMALQEDRKKLEALVKSFPPELIKTLETLLWTGWFNLEELESELGFEITRPCRNFPVVRYQEFAYELLPGFELIAIGEMDGYASWYSSEPKKSRYRVRLPSAIRRLLKPGFPKPEHYAWKVVEIREDTNLEYSRFSAEPTIAADLALIGDYLQRGNLKLTKAGKITAASLRSIMELTPGEEFFPDNTASRKLPALRHSMLIQSVLKFDDKLVKLLSEEPFPAKNVFDQLLPNLLRNKELLMEAVLPHLKTSSFHMGIYSPVGLDGLRQVFATLPQGKWVTSENLVEYPVYRELEVLFMDPYYFRFRADEDSPGWRQGRYYGSTVDLTEETVMDTAQVPLLLGTAFLLAAFGLLEIAYVPPPKHPRWRLPGESFLSPVDGLIGLRLTSLGAYAFGQTRELTIALPEKRSAQVHLHPERPMASCQSADPLTIAAMDEFMERLAPGLYRLTPEKLLAGCHSKEDLSERIEAFRKRIPAEIPDFWEAAFRDYLEAPDPLSCEKTYSVYQIAESGELRRLFATDPVLRRLGLKVEGWRIAGTADDLKRIRERLNALGYLLDSVAVPGKKAASKKKVPPRKSRGRRWY
jgi:hypothetical protein